MKKIILSFIIVMTFIWSCTNNTNEVKETENARIVAVLNEINYENQKMMYLMLSKEDKFTLWEKKIDSLLSNGYLNPKQENLLEDLKNNMSIGIFDNTANNDDKAIFQDVYVKSFLKKAQKLFTANYIYNEFHTISGIAIDGPRSSCTCSAGAVFTCGVGVDCGGASCRVVVTGCGFLGLYDCTGRCRIL